MPTPADPITPGDAGHAAHQARHARHAQHATETRRVDDVPGEPLFDSSLFDPPLPLDDPVPERIGAYRIFGVVGQGGMGVVYEAEQEVPERRVALKVVHAHLATRQYRRRFAQEIRTLGRLEHPGIARIYEGGAAPDDRGELQLYLSMELVCGARVDEHVERHRLDAGAIAELMATICDAVHHAHRKGVIHCDLKPANILVAAGGVPKVLDFGVARIVGDDAIDRTTTVHAIDDATIVGTLAFTSPEQAAGDRNRIDVLTDVHGLGAVLHAMLTGRPPHDLRGRSLPEAIAIVRDGSPAGVRTLRPDVPKDLETIVAKALAVQPADRYDSAASMAADLRRFGAHRPIVARRVPMREVAAKWVRRNRLVTAAIVTACAAVLVGLGVAGASLATTVRALHERDAEASRALAAAQGLRDTLSSLQGAQLPPEARHQRSRVLVASLREDEAPGHPARLITLMPGNARANSGRGQSAVPLVALDSNGDVVASLDRPRRFAPWAAPRFDFEGRFERGVGTPQRCVTLCALLEDTFGDGARRLVRGVAFPTQTMAVLETIDLPSLLAATAPPVGGELWNNGTFADVVWDPARRLLWITATTIELPYCVPELAAWDSAKCPSARDEPTLLVAMHPQHAHGVIAPLVGDVAHPPAKAEWAFTTRPPRAVRDTGDARRPRRTAFGPNAIIEIKAMTPAGPDEPDRLGTLHVTFSIIGTTTTVTASARLDAAGRPVGRFVADRLPGDLVDSEAQDLVALFDPAEEIVSIDLAQIVRGRCEAERTLHAFGDRDAALRAIDTDWRISPARRAEARRCVEAMTSNWRWLLNASAEIVERRDVVAAIGAPKSIADGDGPESDVQAELETAARWIATATEIHSRRCPCQGNGTCTLEWYLENERALSLATLGDWQACHDVAQRSIALHRANIRGPDFALDHAILAMALLELGRRDEAEQSLRTAQRLHGERDAFPAFPESAADLTHRVMERVGELMR